MYIKKNTLTVILCFLGAAVIVAAGAIVKANKGMADVKQIAAYSYQQSFAELAEELDGISDDLQKSIHASSPYQSINLARFAALYSSFLPENKRSSQRIESSIHLAKEGST